MPKAALEGLKIVEYASNSISGSFCTRVLADLGAEVIKVEGSPGDQLRNHGPFPDDVPDPEKSGLFLYLNANKKGVTLNTGCATGRRVFHQLLDSADALVEGGRLAEIGVRRLDHDSLRTCHPQLNVTSITPFGQTGPYKDYKAFDINVCAAGGLSKSFGSPTREPLTLPLSQGGYQAGLSAAMATLVALFVRDLTGEGQLVDISEAEVLATVHAGYYLPAYIYRGMTVERKGRRMRIWGRYPQGAFPCKDGHVLISAIQLSQWIRFLEILGNPEWTKLPRYRNRRAMSDEYPDEVDALWAPWLMAHGKEEIFRMCHEKRVAGAPVWTIDEVANAEHLRVRDYFREIDHPAAGRQKYPGAPYRLSKTPWKVDRPAPLLGEHNAEVYQALGYSKRELAEMRQAGAL